jgi:hypothetical protein
MILRGEGGELVTLAPAGYQFAGVSAERHDDNWLNVAVTASVGGASWGGTDPCLLTWELRGLCTWMRSHAEGGGTAADDLDFLEPELTFQVLERGADPIPLRITMRYALSGGDAGDRDAASSERIVDLRVSRADLAAAAVQLGQEAGAFPER